MALSPNKSHGDAVKSAIGNLKVPSVDSQQHKHIEKNLQSLLACLQKREPLDPSYDSLLPVSFRKHAKASATVNKSADGDAGSKPSSSSKKSNALTADVKLHRRLNANLRSIVETYASTPAGWRRRPNTRRTDIDFGSTGNKGNSNDGGAASAEIDAKLRAAFALRESKEHEQLDLVNTTLKAENAKLRRGWGFSQVTGAGGAGSTVGGAVPGAAPMAGMLPPLEEGSVRKKRLDGIAKQLREKEKGAADRLKWSKIAQRGRSLILNPESTSKAIMKEYQPDSPKTVTINTKTIAKREEVRETKRKRVVDPEQEREQQIEEAKKREKVLRERLEREEEENKRQLEKEQKEQERLKRSLETPRDALHRLYEPIFTALWEMEFAFLGNTNPFRTVIDKSNCAVMGAPDYCDVIEKPMNLTYIQTKVNDKSYESLQEFMEDVDLIVKNALKYNSHPSNPYHVAAKGFRKKFRKLAKPLVQSLTKGMATK
mmetsp:Transcript_24511/g.51985  ORF Transcript_24511/g.51985 Transcript_24511/m.51985 type:complete len:486 (+) Transcript_24511:55-1512(+)